MMDTLPVEMRSEIGNYLTFGDLKDLRFVDSRWNHVAKDKLRSRRRGPMTFIIDSVNTLKRFNDAFAKYQPLGDLASARFCFQHRVLASDEATAHLDTFGQTFGQSVTSLTLRFQRFSTSLFASPKEEGSGDCWLSSKDRNVALLLSKVKGQLQTLELKEYFGLSPSVLGTDPFPALRTLTVNNIDVARNFGPWKSSTVLGRIAAIQEPCVLELSRKVPAIQHFNFGPYKFGQGEEDDPGYLATVLGNLLRANPEVRCKLSLHLPSDASRQSLKFVQNLTQVDAHVCELCLGVPGEVADREDYRLLLEYVGGLSNCLRKLTLVDSRDMSCFHSPASLRLLRMCVLEELESTHVVPIYASSFPSLRRVTMDYSGSDLGVTLPSVRDLTLVHYGNALKAENAGEAFQRFISNFPNLSSVTCSSKFLGLPAFFKQDHLTRLKICDDFSLWDIVTQGSPPLTFGQIVDLDVTPGGETEGAPFKDLENLSELIYTVGSPVEERLNAVLYISKIGKLRRLLRLVFEHGFWATINTEVTTKYLPELQKYHDCVALTKQVFYYNY